VASRDQNVDLASLVNRRPGGVTLADGDVRTAVAWNEVPDIAASGYNEEILLDRELAEGTSITAQSQGLEPETEEPVESNVEEQPEDTLEQNEEPVTEKIIPQKLAVNEGVFERLTATLEAVFKKLTADTASIVTAFIERLTVKRLAVEGETLGSAVLPAGETELVIENPLITEGSQVFLTPRIAVGVPLAVTEILPEESFTVAVSEPQETDIPFSWWIIEGQLTTGEEND